MKYILILGLLISCSSAKPEKPPKDNFVRKCYADSKKTKIVNFYSDEKIIELCKCAGKMTKKSVAEINKDKKLKEKIIKECF